MAGAGAVLMLLLASAKLPRELHAPWAVVVGVLLAGQGASAAWKGPAVTGQTWDAWGKAGCPDWSGGGGSGGAGQPPNPNDGMGKPRGGYEPAEEEEEEEEEEDSWQPADEDVDVRICGRWDKQSGTWRGCGGRCYLRKGNCVNSRCVRASVFPVLLVYRTGVGICTATY